MSGEHGSRESSEAWIGAPLRPDTALEIQYDRVLERAFNRFRESAVQLTAERVQGALLWSELAGLSNAERRHRVVTDPRFQNWGLLQTCLDRCLFWVRNDVVEAVEIARLATLVVDRLEPARYGSSLLADFRGATWRALGNALRVATDFAGAAEAFSRANGFLQEGTQDPLERIQLLSCRSSLEKDLGNFKEAILVLTPGIGLAEQMNDPRWLGRLLVQQATALGNLDPGRAVSLLRRALPLVEAGEDPLLRLSATHSYALFLQEDGRSSEALAVLERSRHLYRQFPLSSVQLRLQWLEAKIARGLGHVEGAARAFEEVAASFLSADLRQEFALVSIDLAETRYSQERYEEALDAVAGLYEILAGWRMHPEGLAVLLLMQSSITQRRVRDQAFREIALYLLQAWHRPIEA